MAQSGLENKYCKCLWPNVSVCYLVSGTGAWHDTTIVPMVNESSPPARSCCKSGLQGLQRQSRLQRLKYSRILRPTTQQAAVRIAARTCGDSCAYPQCCLSPAGCDLPSSAHGEVSSPVHCDSYHRRLVISCSPAQVMFFTYPKAFLLPTACDDFHQPLASDLYPLDATFAHPLS